MASHQTMTTLYTVNGEDLRVRYVTIKANSENCVTAQVRSSLTGDS